MDAWGPLLTAAVTVFGLLFNQWRADKREERRIDQEVAREERRAQRDHSEQLERWLREDQQRWFNDRRKAYESAVATADKVIRLLWRSFPRPPSRDDLEGARAEAISEWDQGIARIRIIASPQVRDAAEAFNELLLTTAPLVPRPELPNPDDIQSLNERVKFNYDRAAGGEQQPARVGAPGLGDRVRG